MNEDLSKTADELYNQFIGDETVVGFEGLMQAKGIRSSRQKNKLRALIYDKYGKEQLQCIYRQRLAKCSHSNRMPASYVISPEQRHKMVEGIKKSWENNDSRRAYSRRLMTKYCSPKSHTTYVNQLRVISRRNGKGWFLHTDETKEKLSEIQRKRWEDGKFDSRKPTLRSKGSIELFDVLTEMGYECQSEYRVKNKPFDVAVPSKKMLFEFNGTYWHLDPMVYDINDFDGGRGLFAWEVWYKDRNKLMEAIRKGYKVFVIWQKDWEQCVDKKTFLMEVINGTNE